MQNASIGQSGIQASRVALGAWAIGGWMWGGQEEGESIRTLHEALDAGINFIDTAPMYGMGESERVVGKAIAGNRDQYIVATKCGMRWDLQKGKLFFRTNEDAIDAEGTTPVHIYNGAESICEEVERSLQRLNTDYIDLLQTHWQDETTPIEETAEAMDKLKQQGKIRAIGVCNASPLQMDAYRAVAQLDSDQEKYSMLARMSDDIHLPYCEQNHIAFLAYSPLGNGLLTGKVGPKRQFPPGDLRLQRPQFNIENRKRVADMLEQLQPIADAHNITLAQLAIAWTLAQPGCSHVLVGARHPQQARENAVGGTVQLSAEELTRIDEAASPLGDLFAVPAIKR